MRKRSLKVALAKGNRHDPTAAEAAAWVLLRDRRCLGLKFRRQHVIRGFIVDFYCAELRLAVEVDGRSTLTGPRPNMTKHDRELWHTQASTLCELGTTRSRRLA